MFKAKTLDFTLSPYTGMTRDSWFEAAEYMLNGVFKHISGYEAPVVLPRTEDEISYPHKDASPDRLERERKAEVFEGLTRTFFIAAPVMKEKPDITINGIRLADYYKKHVLKCVTEGDECFVGTYESLSLDSGKGDPHRCFQQTVETCALVICLDISRGQIWDTYTKDEKDRIAAFLRSFGENYTVPQNWRFFNMLDLAFLHMEGYEIDEKIMEDHVQANMNMYVGDGWFRDGHSFDYYSSWAFNVYAPIWNNWYGYENSPYAAAFFEKASNELVRNYGYFFDRDGFTNMWGRSNVYRFAAVSPLAENFNLRHHEADPGFARRVASGSLLQFLARDDVFVDGVPNLGFYGKFMPLVQGYSCAESPFWMGKAFLCLALPKDSEFWTATENNGDWSSLKKGEFKETTLDGPALCYTNLADNGETVLRTGKVLKNRGDVHGVWNYGKLCYNTKFPWESSRPFDAAEAQQYVLTDITRGDRQIANVTFWCGERDGVLYRRQYFDYRLEDETHWIQGISLADFPVAKGIMRVDRHKLHRRPVRLTLGSYGIPDNAATIKEIEKDGAKAVVFRGKNHCGEMFYMAMTVFYGFDELLYEPREGTNPDSERSIVAYAIADLRRDYDASEPYVLISQVITTHDPEGFSEDELFPIKSIRFSDRYETGAYGDVIITMNNGDVKKVNYDFIENSLTI